MGETGFKCPKCGYTAEFKADVIEVTVWSGCRITEDGWDWDLKDFESDFTDGTHITCCKCGYEANHAEFEEVE